MEVLDKHLTDRITTKDKENNSTNVPDWNRLSIDENDPKFDEEVKKVISDDGVPKAHNNNAVNTPELFDSCIKAEVGLPRGNDGEIYHAMVKGREIYDD